MAYKWSPNWICIYLFRCVHNKMYGVPTYFIQKGISYKVCKIAFLNLVPSLNNWNCGKNWGLNVDEICTFKKQCTITKLLCNFSQSYIMCMFLQRSEMHFFGLSKITKWYFLSTIFDATVVMCIKLGNKSIVQLRSEYTLRILYTLGNRWRYKSD